jgi:hypothetical protein
VQLSYSNLYFKISRRWTFHFYRAQKIRIYFAFSHQDPKRIKIKLFLNKKEKRRRRRRRMK